MMNRKTAIRYAIWIFLVVILSLAMTAPVLAARLAAPLAAPLASASASDLIAEVNSLRASNGLGGLSVNSTLMSSAQKHSEYQAFLGTWTHTGAGGSDETDRAVAEGYGSGKKVICDEAVAVASSDKDSSYVVYTLWGDYTHMNLVLLNSRYTEVGVGVAVSGDLTYYTLDACVVSGEEVNTPIAVTSGASTALATTQPYSGETPSTSNIKINVQTVTPAEDGSIVHVVQPGQTLWDIATAYGKTVLDLVALNGLSATDPVVYVDEKIVVQAQYTATLTPTITNTPRPPTRTPRPTQTALPTRHDPTKSGAVTAQPSPSPSRTAWLDLNNRHTIGIIVIAVSAVGLILVVGAGGFKKRTRDDDEDEVDR